MVKVGDRRGHYVILSESNEKSNGKKSWDLLCDCGNIVVKETSVVNKLVETSNCGCKGRMKSNLSFKEGDVVGCFTVINIHSRNKGLVKWSCVCSCGAQSIKTTSSLSSRKNVFCKNCIPAYSRTSTYASWEAARSRCNNPANPAYEFYGGRGIKMCHEWNDFQTFLKDVGERPHNFVLDRIDPDGDYCKENCRWVDRSESSFNTRRQRNNSSGRTGVVWNKKDKRWYARIEYRGETIHLGSFKNFDDAVKSREDAELLYFGYNKE